MKSVFTGPIFQKLDLYRKEFLEHPLFMAARSDIPTALLKEFAFYQYADSILWVPMLSLMKGKVIRSTRLRRAIEENIACETGLANTSHIELAKNLMRSLHVCNADALPVDFLSDSMGHWLSDEFSSVTEPEIAGWLLLAETLVPLMFAKMKDSFARMGCDTFYFTEHIDVDSEEHSTWMAEAVEDVVQLYGAGSVVPIFKGMREAWLETIEVPDLIYQKLLVTQPRSEILLAE